MGLKPFLDLVLILFDDSSLRILCVLGGSVVDGPKGFGANALMYVYPETDIAIIVLSHAGQVNDDMSWSRMVQARIEKLLSL